MCTHLRKTREKHGFTLMEMLLAASLLALLLGLGLAGLRISQKPGQSRGLAQELKGVLSQARARAVATGLPVGLVFPTAGGSTPVVNQCVVLAGREKARIDRFMKFSGNFPGVGVFNGEWTLPSGMGFAAPTPVPGEDPPRFSLDQWLPATYADDTAIVFLPSGDVVTSGLRTVGGEYAWVVAPRMTVSGTTLTACADAFTVTVSTHGTCRMMKGALGGQVPDGGGEQATWSLTDMGLPTASSSSPVISEVAVYPAPIDTAFASARGAECVVEPNGVITLKVSATDADGGALYCTWTANDGGGFSHQGEVPMEYSPEIGAWTSEWHWKPPTGAAPDQIYGLEVSVRDEEGNLATAASGVLTTPRVLIVDPGVLAFATYLNMSFMSPNTGCHVFAIKYDGTQLRAINESLNTGGFEGGLCTSRDGRRIAIGTDYGSTNLRLISSDGVEVKLVDGGGQRFQRPCFSADGTKVYVARGDFTNPSGWDYVVVSFDNLGNPSVSTSPYNGVVCGWSPDGTQALVEHLGDVKTVAADFTETLIHSASSAEGPGVALDWNSRGVYFGANLVDDGYNTGIGTQVIYKESSGVTSSLGSFPMASDVAGDGRFIFQVRTGIEQYDLDNSVSREILSPFVHVDDSRGGFIFSGTHPSMGSFVRYLSASR